MYIKSTQTTLQLVLSAGDEPDLEQLIDGVPLKAFLEPQVCTPGNVVRIKEALRWIADEEALKAATRRAQEKPTFVAEFAREVGKLTAEEHKAIKWLLEARKPSLPKTTTATEYLH
jgi:hypothetical protein